MDATPLFILEEHHEAFLIWHYAIRRGMMAPTGNALLHCDSHADICMPSLSRPIPGPSSDLPTLRDFTYAELKVGTFVAPAVYHRVFDSVCWLAPKLPASAIGLRRLYVRTLHSEGRHFLLAPDPGPWAPAHRHQDRVTFAARAATVAHPVSLQGPVALDIDLDYFSCEAFVYPPVSLEVTREEYERYLGDRYHPLRAAYPCRAYEEGGRFYVHLNPLAGEEVRDCRRLGPEAILERMDALLRYLQAHEVKPCLISISRSRLTGYTPVDQWEFIEGQLLARMRDAYGALPRHIEEVLGELSG